MSPHRKPQPVGILRDDADGRRTLRAFMLAGSLTVGVVIAVYTSVQAVLILGVFSEALSGSTPLPALELSVRIGVNLIGAAAMAVGVILLAPERRRGLARAGVLLGIAVAAALLRAVLQVTVRIYDVTDPDHVRALVTEVVSTALLIMLALGVGLIAAEMWARARSLDQHRLAMQARSVQLLRDLQDEELRVRRELAETIHGSVQGTFVVLEARLRHIAGQVGPEHADPLDAIASHLATLREGDLRAMSAELYPVDLDRGMDAAIRGLTARMPAWVTVDDQASETLAVVEDDLIQEARVLIVRVIEDALSNALKHGAARRIRMRAGLSGGVLEVVVDNDGEPLPASPTLSGLARLRRRAEALDGALGIARGPAGGTLITVRLPLHASSPATVERGSGGGALAE